MEREYLFHGVSERDMDLLLLQALSLFPDFIQLFTNQTEWKDEKCSVCGIELSKTETNLGESDITVYLDYSGHKRALLIEDKIDAIAMPDQHGRYIKRGDKALKRDEYEDYEVFIVCPEKYRKKDAEAKKYEHFVSYEQCLAFFEADTSVAAMIFRQQIQQALNSAKSASKTEINKVAVQSFAKYIEYQRENYPKLKPKNDGTSGKVNGWWPEFRVSLENAIIIHKTPTGTMDLTFGRAATKIERLETIADYFSKYYGHNIEAVITGKSAALRMRVPVIQMGTPFESWNMEHLTACLDAAMQLTEIASAIKAIKSFYN